MSKLPQSIITAIDIGTTKISVLIAQTGADSSCAIMGIGHAPSLGLARGVVVEIAPAVAALKAAIHEAELMAGCHVTSANIGASGSHIKATNSHGMVQIKHGIVRPSDIQHVLGAAQAVTLPEGQQLLHVVPQLYVIDGCATVRDPQGLAGMRLEAHVQLITGSTSSLHNLVQCCELAGVRVDKIVLEPIASAAAVLSNDERELGVGVLDIGGGTADFAVYQRNGIRHTKIIPVAGALFTHDLAICLRVPLAEAERLKTAFGSVNVVAAPSTDSIATVDVDGITQRTTSAQDIATILLPRAVELLAMVEHEIEHHRLRGFMPSGIVITGGGALLGGLKELAADILRMPVRIGTVKLAPHEPPSLNHPRHATGYGLLKYVIEQNKSPVNHHARNPLGRLLANVKEWVSDAFS